MPDMLNNESANLEKENNAEINNTTSEDDKDKTLLKCNSKDESLNQQEDKTFNQIKQKIQEIERQSKEDVSKVEMLLKSGILNPKQGESLIQQIIKKGYDELQQVDLKFNDNVKVQSENQDEKQFDKKQAIIEFEKEKPDFFNQEGRLDVLNYIKSGILEFDKQELVHISNLVERIEQAAIERYIKQAEYEAKLKQTNDEAKSRLSANAQNAKDTSNKQIAFTREQIGKMSSSEFNKNEKLIMEQLRQGLIR